MVAIADPTNLAGYGLAPIDRTAETAALEAATAGLPVKLTVLPVPCSLQAIEAALWRDYHVLHFVGHGIYKEQAGAALYLTGDDNCVAITYAGDITAMFNRLAGKDSPLQLVFLGSCQTASTSPATRSAAWPRSFCRPASRRSWRCRTWCRWTRPELAATFYSQLLQHGVVDLAANQARASLLTAKLPGAAIPVLFMRLKNGRMFDVEDFQPIPECPYPGMTPFGNDGKYPFYGASRTSTSLYRSCASSTL